ncbi:MAG: PA2778 family cysteine peptidase, partial [Steroidobacteraceae bacterium]
EFQCGPAALATVLAASGVEVTPEALAPKVYLPERKGSFQAELIGAARRYGRMAYRLPEIGDALIAELAEGRPVLVLQNLGLARRPVWHYAVLIGYDADENVAILRSGRERRLAMRWQRFARSWHTAGRWAISTFAPGIVPESVDSARYQEAAAGLEAAGQNDAAARAWDAWLARMPDEPYAWLGRGNLAYERRDFAAAAEAYARAVELAPADAAMRNNLAQVLSEAGCHDEARRQAARAVSLAEGSELEKLVGETRAAIHAAADRSGRPACAFPDRAWPD